MSLRKFHLLTPFSLPQLHPQRRQDGLLAWHRRTKEQATIQTPVTARPRTTKRPRPDILNLAAILKTQASLLATTNKEEALIKEVTVANNLLATILATIRTLAPLDTPVQALFTLLGLITPIMAPEVVVVEDTEERLLLARLATPPPPLALPQRHIPTTLRAILLRTLLLEATKVVRARILEEVTILLLNRLQEAAHMEDNIMEVTKAINNHPTINLAAVMVSQRTPSSNNRRRNLRCRITTPFWR